MKYYICPFCNGIVRFEQIIEMIYEKQFELRCTCCGMKFSYVEHFAASKDARIRLNKSLEDVWNGRKLDG